jgi:hypothetical protein
MQPPLEPFVLVWWGGSVLGTRSDQHVVHLGRHSSDSLPSAGPRSGQPRRSATALEPRHDREDEHNGDEDNDDHRDERSADSRRCARRTLRGRRRRRRQAREQSVDHPDEDGPVRGPIVHASATVSKAFLPRVWLSPSLAGHLTHAEINRRTNLTGDGSDHDPAWVRISL